MTTIINASHSGSGGLVQTADASGVLALQTAGTTAVERRLYSHPSAAGSRHESIQCRGGWRCAARGAAQ